MIKIIKPGKLDFRITCDKCGCIFEYTMEDIYDSFVKCPTCGKRHCVFQDIKLSDMNPVGSFRISTDYDCSNCDWHKKRSQLGFLYAGDTPCQWCSKSPYRITSTTNSYSEYKYNNDSTYIYDQYAEQEDSGINKLCTCTAEGVSYEFATDHLGTYEISGVTIELSKN